MEEEITPEDVENVSFDKQIRPFNQEGCCL